MTLTGQAFWRARDAIKPLPISDCPCCGRPLPLAGSVMDQAMPIAEATFGVTRAAIMGESRTRPISAARAMVVWALRSTGEGRSYEAIARLLGGRHRSSMVSLHQKAIRLRLSDQRFSQACDRIVFAMAGTKENLDVSQ